MNDVLLDGAVEVVAGDGVVVAAVVVGGACTVVVAVVVAAVVESGACSWLSTDWQRYQTVETNPTAILHNQSDPGNSLQNKQNKQEIFRIYFPIIFFFTILPHQEGNDFEK